MLKISKERLPCDLCNTGEEKRKGEKELVLVVLSLRCKLAVNCMSEKVIKQCSKHSIYITPFFLSIERCLNVISVQLMYFKHFNCSVI